MTDHGSATGKDEAKYLGHNYSDDSLAGTRRAPRRKMNYIERQG